MPTKKCFKCKKTKPLDMFYKHKQMADGHVGKCKACNKKDVQKNYRKNIDHYREYDKARFQTSERKEKKKQYDRNRDLNSPGKRKANSKVANAIRNGVLVKKPCEVCGNPKVEAHHRDYRKWLDVAWLCFKHHRAEHGQTVK